MRINFDFTDLEAFLAVKETGSFHLASERLNLSQSSISRRIQKLEEALGSPLFERTTRAVKPTLAAKRLHQRAEAILEDMRETTRAMRDESASQAFQMAQTVTLAILPTLIPGVLAPALAQLLAAGVAPRLRVLDLAANEVAEAVAQGEADIGLSAIPMLEPSTEFELLFSDPMVLALPRAHAFCQQDSLTWAALADQELILPARGTGNRLLIDEAMARASLPLRWRFEVGRSSSALDLVAAGIGIAPLPRSALVTRPTAAVELRALSGPAVSRPVGLLRRAGQVDSARLAPLVAALRRATEGPSTLE